MERLRQHFRSRRDVYVSGNLLLYYQEGNPRAVVAPDVFVVLGASNADRSTYRLWEEPKGPDFHHSAAIGRTRRPSGLAKPGRHRPLWNLQPGSAQPTRHLIRRPPAGMIYRRRMG